MKPQSAKAKSRRLQNKAVELVAEKFGFSEHQIRAAIMGESGMDVKLSETARLIFPFAMECKNQEKLNIWASLQQAEENADGLTPLLIFKRNHSRTYVALEFDDFLNLLAR